MTPHARSPRYAPLIRLSGGRGDGPTALAAFDAALGSAGLAGFNLVRLSSVIPAGARVEVVSPPDQIPGEHGDLLYCVYAHGVAAEPGTEIWAGVAWALRDDGSGAGLFVEHHATTRAGVDAELSATIGAMMARRPESYVEAGRLLSHARCDGDPAAAVVVASYRSVGWDEPMVAAGTAVPVLR
ncbi:pyruvoyl-dependent arginine decarboxylase [uncultured Friedmanniella sp.]|uniref:pyruvoyl-dependent arginine decarboxylase n=1 Tax=uncultured Friedmanniella sp. TaxID=335381 RepID=UPI0035CA74BB